MIWLRKTLGLWLILLTAAWAASSGSRHLLMMGATSVLPYLKASVGRWTAGHPELTVAVSGGGSWAGLSALQHGHADIAVSDLPEDAWPVPPTWARIPLGRLPVLLVVHPGTGVANLSRHALQALFSGKVRSWAELGGKSIPVTVVVRPQGSGARAVVERYLGRPQLGPNVITQLSNGAVLAAVAETPGAIGYVEGLRLIPGVTPVGIDGRGFSPMQASQWPLWAESRLYVPRRRLEDPAVLALVTWLAQDPERTRYGLFPPSAADPALFAHAG
ncbi:MAG: substrate-binding domain-containing protein [Firmicutes bacterium]|nr:substrate-binding domain-containing protein [Bacillota bacterium]